VTIRRRRTNHNTYHHHGEMRRVDMQAPTEQQRQQAEWDGTDEQASFLSLIRTHDRLLMKVCWAYTNTSHDRDDLFQEIIGRLWSAFAKYDRNRKFSTWMYRVALNVAIDFRRRQQRRWPEAQSLDETQHSPQRSTRRDMHDELRELLEKQSEADRAILLLYLEGNSHREIGAVVGISESNVGTRLSRLKKSLRQSAKKSGSEYQE